MPKVSQAQIDSIKQKNKKGRQVYQFAYSFDVNIDLKTKSTVDTLNIGVLYRYEIESSDAYSINVIFSEYEVPRGAKLFLYNEGESHIIGAFTSGNNKPSKVLPTVPVKGDKIIVEYFEPLYPEFEGTIKIGKIGHDFLNFYNLNQNFGSSGNCNIDINCPNGNAWQNEKRAVCKIIIDGSGLCSGSLINNTSEDGSPYFLTAEHCISSQNAAENSVFIFNYESPTCNGSNGSQNQLISGANLRANDGITDFTLLELSKLPLSTYNPFYAGWDRSTNPPQNGSGIHHPSGDVKKISVFNNQAEAYLAQFDCNAPFDMETWRLQFESGVTEGGSSGSPIFNQNRHIVGQLFGTTCENFINCNNEDGDAVYGRFDISWNGNGTNDTRLRN